MPRRRNSEGTLDKVGKRRKMWRGYWFVYVKVGDREVYRKREKIIGPATMPKHEARAILRRLIAESRCEIPALPERPTFAHAWERYKALKSGQWGKSTEKTLTSLFKTALLPRLGHLFVDEITFDPLQALLVEMARAGRSLSAIQKARLHLKAVFEYAVGERLIPISPVPGRQLKIPAKLVKAVDKRYLSIDQVRKLLEVAQAAPREHLILRLLLVGGFRSQELFVLRVDDVGPGQIRVDEALKRHETGERRLGEPKTMKAAGPVVIPQDLDRELREWLAGLPDQAPRAWLFPAAHGGSLNPRDHLDDVLKPLAQSAGVEALDFQMLRRTCATYFRQDVKSAQAQLRHSTPATTAGVYQQTISADHRAAVEALDAEFTGRVTTKKVVVLQPRRAQ